MAVRICAWNKIYGTETGLVCMEGWLCAYAHGIKYNEGMAVRIYYLCAMRIME